MPTEVLNPDEARDFRALARMIIPPSETYRVPGADDELIFADICRSLERDFADVRRALSDLKELSGGAFAELPPARRAGVANALREKGGAPLMALVRVVLLCYYRDDRVMQSLGQEPRSRPTPDTSLRGAQRRSNPARAKRAKHKPRHRRQAQTGLLRRTRIGASRRAAYSSQ
jgi:hypothetical protein